MGFHPGQPMARNARIDYIKNLDTDILNAANYESGW
jgi:hypothetical protein